jgi:hypothetical protein
MSKRSEPVTIPEGFPITKLPPGNARARLGRPRAVTPPLAPAALIASWVEGAGGDTKRTPDTTDVVSALARCFLRSGRTSLDEVMACSPRPISRHRFNVVIGVLRRRNWIYALPTKGDLDRLYAMRFPHQRKDFGKRAGQAARPAQRMTLRPCG